MRFYSQIYAASIAFALIANTALARGLYSQIIVTLPQMRPYKYEYYKIEHTLVVFFEKTSATELSAFEKYDERIIKRVILKDQSPLGTEVKIVLRDRDVKAMVQSFQEPARIVIDLFDSDYELEKDLKTGFPIASLNSTHVNQSQKAPHSTYDIQKHRLLLDEGESGHESKQSDSTDATRSPTSAGSSRRLLQPLGQPFIRPEDMEKSLAGVPDGVGKAWRDFPPYMYRLQTAPYEEGGSRTPGESSSGAQSSNLGSYAMAISSAASMADYAGKLFNLGQESKALVAYQQVLLKEPSIFDKDALSLWKLAETQLGQGNLTLARGYYESLVEKHPESPLANFARIRVLDVAAIRLMQKGRFDDLPSLVEKLSLIKLKNQGELSAQIGLRRAYWEKEGTQIGSNYSQLPLINSAIYAQLSTNYPNVESNKTAFLSASILLNDMVRMDKPWVRSIGPFADAYFKRFNGAPTEPYRTALKEALFRKINKSIQSKATEGQLIDAIDDYEALPASMSSVKKDPKTAWALGEAYRKLSNPRKAIDFYAEASKLPAGTIDRFKAEFWLASLAYSNSTESKGSGRQNYTKIYQDSDQKLRNTWQALSESDRESLNIAYKEHFEKIITDGAKLRTVATIVLSNWSRKLNTKTTVTGGASTGQAQIDKAYSPSGSAVFLLSDLGKLFGKLGMSKERSEALSLLKSMKPADFPDDQGAKQAWANQLFTLAEDYRKANQYLDAGKLYSLVGENSENWEKRAETLYKGGLLLFRAGRKQEAISSFQKASDDGNNLFYANLAKERLAQIQ